jgi:hypothetical protein
MFRNVLAKERSYIYFGAAAAFGKGAVVSETLAAAAAGSAIAAAEIQISGT